MSRYVELCVEMRKAKAAKDGLTGWSASRSTSVHRPPPLHGAGGQGGGDGHLRAEEIVRNGEPARL